MGRPPLRELPVREPTREELLANAVAALRERGKPNRNLLRTVRWIYGDLSPTQSLPENIRRKHMPEAGKVCRLVEAELRETFRWDSIACRRDLRRRRIASRRKNYRWTRFPAAGPDTAALDNAGRPAAEPARAGNLMFGLERVHPNLVGFGHVADSAGRLARVRRIFGLENVWASANEPEDGGIGMAGLDGVVSSVPALRPLRRGFVFPPERLPARRRFVLPVSAAGPPGVILFPAGAEREVLLYFPGGSLRVAALCSPAPGCASGLVSRSSSLAA